MNGQDSLRPLAEAPVQAWLNDRFQVADILRSVLMETGPADVRISSFSISEEFLRRLLFIRREGLIRSLEIVLDFKATHKTLKLWPFIAQTVDSCYLADNHSKIILVRNGRMKVAVITSQNLTRGNRNESGIVTTNPAVVDGLDARFSDLVNNKSVLFHDVYSRTIGEN